ncbi:hypothetical protein [Pseudomonas syringae group genomosp. 3]|nr:hypothetical protein [Pseudomonas syringae group genomosp. 3]
MAIGNWQLAIGNWQSAVAVLYLTLRAQGDTLLTGNEQPKEQNA